MSLIWPSNGAWQWQGGSAGSWARWELCEEAAQVRDWATSSEVHLSGFFCCGSQILLHCRAYSSNSSFSPNPSPGDFSRQFACTAVSPFPHLHKSFLNCFLLAAFSQLLPVQTEPHSEGGYEILCIRAGLMFSTSVLHWVKTMFLTSSTSLAFYVQHKGKDGPSLLHALSAVLSLLRREAPCFPIVLT